MHESSESYKTTFISTVTKRHIFMAIIFFMIISFLITFNSSNSNISSLRVSVTKQVNKSTQTTTSKFILTTPLTTRLISKLIGTTIKMNSTTTTTTTTNNDEILCDNLIESRTENISSKPCERIRCAILLRSSGGRLGNRMFMFASAYGLTRTHNCRLHVAAPILHELSINFQMKSIDENMWLSETELNQLKNIENKGIVCSFLPELTRLNAFKNIEMTGYWQSYLYFDAYREEIREIFSARNDALIRLAKYFTDITKKTCSSCSPLPSTTHKELRQAFQTHYNITWISIHIRRADFRGLGYASDDDYIRRAIMFYRRRYHRNRVHFLVASDDRNYCHQLFANEQKSGRIIILPDHFSPADDLMALSLCHHSIVTGGTFGFWSAYLAGGEVIHDVKYKAGCSRSDYYPPWFILAGMIEEKKV